VVLKIKPLDKWKERNKGAKRNKGRAILVDNGFLKKGNVRAKNGFKIKVKKQDQELLNLFCRISNSTMIKAELHLLSKHEYL
jgi:hypothetical protein